VGSGRLNNNGPKEIIEGIHVENAADISSSADYGIHYMVIYSDLTTLREFYAYYIKKRIEEYNDIVLFAPFYETTDSVRQTLSKGHMAIDVCKYEEEGTLVIVDSLKNYFSQEESDWFFKERMVKQAKKIGKSGFSIIGDIGAFPYVKNLNKLVDYELSLPCQYEIDLKGFCLYHQNDFNILSKDQKQKLIEHHGLTIRIA
jgi:DcmR-like sensory protein